MIWKTSEKKNQTETQNAVDGHSSKLKQMEGRISEPENKIEIKEKVKELLVKQLKTCNKTVQEFTNSIKRPKLRPMGIGGEVVQAK
jgi:hypothetical protein